MRHLVAHRKLRRNQGHRMALLKNLVASLIENERIVTMVAKAKETRPLAEKMITLGKKGTVHHRRLAFQFINRAGHVKKVFDTLAPRFSARNGGYTRIIHLDERKGDGAEMAILEFVDYQFKKKDKKEKKETAPKS